MKQPGVRPRWLLGSGLIQRRSNSILKTTVLAKQGSIGHDAACRLPGNNVRFGGKYRVKKEMKIALAMLSRGAGNEAEERYQKNLHVFFEMVQRKQTCWDKGSPFPSCLVILRRNPVAD